MSRKNYKKYTKFSLYLNKNMIQFEIGYNMGIYMRKFLLTFLFVFSSFSYCLSEEIIISPNELPDNIKTFVQKYFPGTSIMYAEIDYNEYDIRLNSGTEIEFDRSGEWKEIKAYQNFPTELLPKAAVKAIKKTYPDAFIIKAERIWNGFEIKTNNMMEIYIDNNGSILGQKYDN